MKQIFNLRFVFTENHLVLSVDRSNALPCIESNTIQIPENKKIYHGWGEKKIKNNKIKGSRTYIFPKLSPGKIVCGKKCLEEKLSGEELCVTRWIALYQHSPRNMDSFWYDPRIQRINYIFWGLEPFTQNYWTVA